MKKFKKTVGEKPKWMKQNSVIKVGLTNKAMAKKDVYYRPPGYKMLVVMCFCEPIYSIKKYR